MPRRFALVVLLASARTYAEPTAADVANAPLPGEESGRTDPVDDGDTPAREVARAALFVPRWGIELALTPAHEALWAWDRYQVDERGGEAAESGSMHLGFSASLGYESGFGIDGVIGGGRLTAHNFGGEHE